jgi:protein arginine kinase activator
MLCDVCHKNIATVHLTEIVDDKVVEMHICQKCAQLKAEELKEQLSIADLLGGLVDMEGEIKEKVILKCSCCGLSYEEFKKKGRLGCRDCYITFKQRLLTLLKRIHGATRHTGKVPLIVDEAVSCESKLRDLREKLLRSIKLEEYERAARLRDEIKKLEKKISQLGERRQK